MAASLAHRGPDELGTFADEDVQLAAVRLAIVDVAGGHQPVRGCTPAVACVYNGELYNGEKLRAELVARGHTVADACDSSLVPHLYEDHGAALVERMRGMFGLALWDARQRMLLLARDRLGIKPLFYARTREFLIVASEVKAILASGLVERAVDRDALDDLFSLGYPCPPRTMFAGVVELRPAHLLSAHARGVVELPRRYWRAPFVARGAHRERSAGELAEGLGERLRDAVRTHLVADVPVAAALSGGLDSSTIAALAKEVSGRAPATFSIGFDDPAFDESAHARAMSRWLGGEAHEIRASAADAARLPEMIWQTELPLLMPGAIGGLLLSERQRAAGVRVALTGDGADELFGGYDVFRAEKVRRTLDGSMLRFARPWLFRAVGRLSGQPRGLAAAVERDAARSDEVAAKHGGVVPPWYDVWQLLDVERAALLSPDGRAVRPSTEPPAGFAALVRDDVGTLESARRAARARARDALAVVDPGHQRSLGDGARDRGTRAVPRRPGRRVRGRAAAGHEDAGAARKGEIAAGDGKRAAERDSPAPQARVHDADRALVLRGGGAGVRRRGARAGGAARGRPVRRERGGRDARGAGARAGTSRRAHAPRARPHARARHAALAPALHCRPVAVATISPAGVGPLARTRVSASQIMSSHAPKTPRSRSATVPMARALKARASST